MRHFGMFLLTLAVIVISRPAIGGCTAPEGENQTPCISCGNLEQNVERALDLAWNELLRNNQMQLQLRVFGATRVHLTNPPHSSPGVLYYTVVIEDTQFEVTNTESHSEAEQLMRTWGVGGTASAAGMHAEWLYRRSLTTRVEDLLSQSVSTGSGPYIMRLFDSKGNRVDGGTAWQPRLTGEQALALVGPRDLNPDSQYANEACVPVDPRQESDSSAGTGTNGGGDGSDQSDYWEGWGNGYGDVRPMCRPDFSDPAGAGVICVT